MIKNVYIKWKKKLVRHEPVSVVWQIHIKKAQDINCHMLWHDNQPHNPSIINKCCFSRDNVLVRIITTRIIKMLLKLLCSASASSDRYNPATVTNKLASILFCTWVDYFILSIWTLYLVSHSKFSHQRLFEL